LPSRRGIGEVIGSVSMLAITIALLGGATYLTLSSISGAASMVGGSAQEEARDAGLLVNVVGSQSNSSGTYVWLLDYGWTSATVGSVLVDTQPVPWSTTCHGDWSGTLCSVELPPGTSGLTTIVLGGKSLEVSV
jgi:hypothetical protein